MRSKYEISVWTDEFDEKLDRFVEKKLITIGSDTMTSESRAREPKLVNNINGTNKFTFNMYHSYIDTRTGEKVQNPYIQYLVNERKIKVFWKGEWYHLLIKQIKEDQEKHLFTYICEDAYITELSRTGFELTFNTDLQNNIGTAEELVNAVIKNTDWRFSTELSDDIYQKTEEAVYECTVLKTFTAAREPDIPEVETNIYAQRNILVFYSCAQDKDNLKKDNFQFYYTGGSFKHDENEMLVTNGTSYHVNIDEWDVNAEDNTATAIINGEAIFTIRFSSGLSENYRAERYVQSNKTSYNSVLKRYVNEYENGIYGYQTTEYTDVSMVANLFTNASNFSNFSGWGKEEEDGDLLYRLYPPYGSDTVVSNYKTTSFLRLKGSIHYTNTGIQNNRTYIPNGFINGDKYIFRFKVRSGSSTLPYDENNYLSELTINFKIDDYFEADGNQTYDANTHWVTQNFNCIKSCSYDNLSSLIISLSLPGSNYYWIEEIQFYKVIQGTVKDEEKILEPGEVNAQGIAKVVWKYFTNEDNKDVINQKDFIYCYISEEPWEEAIPKTNNYLRFGTIEEDDSNRFNILQSIAETFECWVRFYIDSEDNGAIKYDDKGPRKFIYLKREAGQETGIGFVYGIDLKSVIRNIKSDKISTKTIVRDNENQFGLNGFCSIARSTQNFPRDNVIYNFDYYISHGLLDRGIVYTDLYTKFNNGQGYYSQLHRLNSEYDENLKLLSNIKIELNRQTANYTVYEQYITSADEELSNIEDSLFKLTSTDNIDAAISYANNHPKNTKVITLLNDRALIETDKNKYQNLKNDISENIEDLTTRANTVSSRQTEIIEELTELNTAFYQRYARFIQEGTWSSEDYWNDDLYYLDAIQVAYTSSRPQISYDINVLRISDIEEYSSKVFHLGDISFVQDTEYFGYLSDRITPYKERVVLTEITSFFDTPDKDTIKVQNYKTQFDDLFQRITAAVQSLEFSEGKYARVSNIVNEDGTIKSSVIQNTFLLNKDLVYGAQNDSATIDNTGITVIDTNDKSKIVRVTSGGIFVSGDGGETWKNAVRGDGITADVLTAGHINTEQISIYNGDYPSFCWDPHGLNAYKFIDNVGVDTSQFVRFDQYGIYGMKESTIDYVPVDEEQVYQDAKFGLTWNRFFMKASGNGEVKIDSNEGIVVTNSEGLTLFKCSPNSEGIAATIGGWNITDDAIESIKQGDENRQIRIQASGNIGSYGGDSYSIQDYVYKIEMPNTIPEELNPKSQTTGESITILKGKTIYPFFSSVGKTKTQLSIGSKIDSKYEDKNNVPEEAQIIPSNHLLFWYNEDTYRLEGDGLDIRARCIYAKGREDKWIDPSSQIETTVIIYTYKFDLNFYYVTTDEKGKTKETLLFTIPYTEIIESGDTPTEKRDKYVPAANTSWTIDKDGTATFHEIFADGGQIAGWWIDNEKIYQTYDGTKEGRIKTQLNSNGTANKDGFDYSIITDAINAAMASIGGVLMSGGLINGYSIAAVAAEAAQANVTAQIAQATADEAAAIANQALSLAQMLNRLVSQLTWHTHAVSGDSTGTPIMG